MRLIVTGGLGFIGSAVVRRAVSVGHEVMNLDKETYAANRANVAPVADNPRYRFERVDICDAERLSRLFADFRPDAVMHLAAESHVDRSIDGPAAFIETNITGTYQLLETARGYLAGLPDGARRAFRFHHVSTDEVFGNLGAEGQFTETTPYAPRSPYSASKAASDHLVRAWGETYGLPVIVTNCSNNYGPYHFPEKLIPKTIISALSGEQIDVYGRGENVRDWLFVEDHAEALLLTLARGRLGETYNIGGSAEARNLDIVRRICSILDARRPEGAPHERLIAFVTDRPGHDFRYSVDTSKIRDELGWRPSVTLAEGLERTVDWFIANEDWWRAVRERGYDGSRLGVGPSAVSGR